MTSENFSVAGLRIQLTAAHPVRCGSSFLPFWQECADADIRIRFEEVPALPELSGKCLFQDDFRAVFEENGRFRKQYRERTEGSRPYALTDYDWESGEGLVQYESRCRSRFEDSHGLFSHIGFEELLMSRDRLILHASLIETPMGGILFSGVSGIGKSTQADLWHRYEGSGILNGDRPILFCNQGIWEAWGSPYAGSSGYHLNRKAPIRAIVLLEQGKTCRISRLSPGKAFCGLYGQITFNSWDPGYVQKVCTLLENLVGVIPVYHYCCTKDETAVRVLRQTLAEEDDCGAEENSL